jgi:hypothetical protein
MARGPLFQEAITIVARQREIRGNLTLNVAQELSNNLAENSLTHWFKGQGLRADLRSVIRNVSAQIPIKTNNTGCAGECETRINVRIARASLQVAYAMIFVVPLSRSDLTLPNIKEQLSLHFLYHVLCFYAPSLLFLRNNSLFKALMCIARHRPSSNMTNRSLFGTELGVGLFCQLRRGKGAL